MQHNRLIQMPFCLLACHDMCSWLLLIIFYNLILHDLYFWHDVNFCISLTLQAGSSKESPGCRMWVLQSSSHEQVAWRSCPPILSFPHDSHALGSDSKKKSVEWRAWQHCIALRHGPRSSGCLEVGWWHQCDRRDWWQGRCAPQIPG